MEIYTESALPRPLDFTDGLSLGMWVEQVRASAWRRLQTLWLLDPLDYNRTWPVIHGGIYVCVGAESHEPEIHRAIREPELSKTYGVKRVWKLKQENREEMYRLGQAHAQALSDMLRGVKTL